MIQRLTVKNYRCLKDVTVELTPFHAFIGPNDSGKSTLLEALRLGLDLAAGRANIPPDLLDPSGLVEVGLPEGVVRISASGKQWRAEVRLPALQKEGEFGSMGDSLRNLRLGRSQVVRLDPNQLRRPSGLIVDGQPVSFAGDRGFGLPGVYDAILNRGDDGFRRITDQVRAAFPTISRIKLRKRSATEKGLEVELLDGTHVPAERLSEGLLYFLAFAALAEIEPRALLTVEEPENGLHPTRIAEVVQILRKLTESGQTQVVLATHSPLVINEMDPEEISVVTRPTLERGTEVTRIGDTPHFTRRSSVYSLGELWLSYANGTDEAPLLAGEPLP